MKKKNNEKDQKIKSKELFTDRKHLQVGISADYAIKNLIDSIEKSSKAANRLAEKIKFLNWSLIIIGIIGLILGAFSIYLQFFRK